MRVKNRREWDTLHYIISCIL